MDRGSFLEYCLLAMGVALAVFYGLKARRRASVPLLVWWLCLILGAVTCMYGLFQSAPPSFATRLTTVGRTYDLVEHRQGRDTSYYSFRLVPDGSQPVNIETRIIIPDWGHPAIFNGRTFRVVYLDDHNRLLKNEAIELEILSGEHAGYRDSLDARPLGKWLGIPLGAALGAFGYFGLRYRKADAMPAPSELPLDYTEQQKEEFKQQFKVRRRRQNMLAVPLMAVLIPAMVGRARNWQGSILGLPVSVYLFLALVTVLAALAFSFRNWRCPACDTYLGQGISPKRCQKCGIALQ